MRKTLEQRFWENVVVYRDGCWGWASYTNGLGYGVIHVRRRLENFRKNIYAHRLSWEIHFGPVPDDLFVLHRCDNPACCRPDHLFLGTNTDNMKDCVAKGRDNRAAKALPGEKNPQAKLTEADVLAIRCKPRVSRFTLAKMFGVTESCIAAIRGGKGWKHVG